MKMKSLHTHIYGMQWKAVLRGKLIALSVSKKKQERAITSSLTAQVKVLEQKEADTPKMAENNKTQSRNQWNKNKKSNTKNQQN